MRLGSVTLVASPIEELEWFFSNYGGARRSLGRRLKNALGGFPCCRTTPPWVATGSD
jgi:hypothetical protein